MGALTIVNRSERLCRFFDAEAASRSTWLTLVTPIFLDDSHWGSAVKSREEAMTSFFPKARVMGESKRGEGCDRRFDFSVLYGSTVTGLKRGIPARKKWLSRKWLSVN